MRKELLAVFSGFPEHHFSVEISKRLRTELIERKSLVFITACPLDYEQNDDDCDGMYQMFAEQGLPFEKHCVIDKRTEPKLAKEFWKLGREQVRPQNQCLEQAANTMLLSLVSICAV